MNLEGGNLEYYKKPSGVEDWVDDIDIPKVRILITSETITRETNTVTHKNFSFYAEFPIRK